MTLAEQVYAQGVLLSGVEEPVQCERLQLFSKSAIASLRSKLRAGLTPEDCRADFIAAAALYALAALSETDELGTLQQVQLGDLTLRRSTDSTAARCLRTQAELIMAPYLADRFSFRRV